MAQGKPKPRTGATSDTAEATPPPIKRQAVVIVHGQGEQRPMGTVRDFVDALWSKNEELDVKGEKYPRPRATWTVPDDRNGLYELQRITTPSDIERKTDFFELYYADLFVDTPLRNLLRWMTRLLWRPASEVDGPIRGPWQALWLLVLAALACAGTAVIYLPDLLRTPAAALWTGPEAQPGTILVALALLGACCHASCRLCPSKGVLLHLCADRLGLCRRLDHQRAAPGCPGAPRPPPHLLLRRHGPPALLRRCRQLSLGTNGNRFQSAVRAPARHQAPARAA